MVVLEGIAAMRVVQQPPREDQEADKGLIMEDLDWERPDREIRVDIILLTALAEAEAVPEEREVTPAAAGVGMVEMEFSPTSLVWPLGTVAVERAGRGTEPVVRVEWAAEETQEVIPRLRGRMGQPIPEVAAAEMDMPRMGLRVRADRVL